MGRVRSLCKGPYVSPTYADPQRTLPSLAHGQGQGCPLEWDSIYSPQPRKAVLSGIQMPMPQISEPCSFLAAESGQVLERDIFILAGEAAPRARALHG